MWHASSIFRLRFSMIDTRLNPWALDASRSAPLPMMSFIVSRWPRSHARSSAVLPVVVEALGEAPRSINTCEPSCCCGYSRGMCMYVCLCVPSAYIKTLSMGGCCTVLVCSVDGGRSHRLINDNSCRGSMGGDKGWMKTNEARKGSRCGRLMDMGLRGGAGHVVLTTTRTYRKCCNICIC